MLNDSMGTGWAAAVSTAPDRGRSSVLPKLADHNEHRRAERSQPFLDSVNHNPAGNAPGEEVRSGAPWIVPLRIALRAVVVRFCERVVVEIDVELVVELGTGVTPRPARRRLAFRHGQPEPFPGLGA